MRNSACFNLRINGITDTAHHHPPPTRPPRKPTRGALTAHLATLCVTSTPPSTGTCARRFNQPAAVPPLRARQAPVTPLAEHTNSAPSSSIRLADTHFTHARAAPARALTQAVTQTLTHAHAHALTHRHPPSHVFSEPAQPMCIPPHPPPILIPAAIDGRWSRGGGVGGAGANVGWNLVSPP